MRIGSNSDYNGSVVFLSTDSLGICSNGGGYNTYSTEKKAEVRRGGLHFIISCFYRLLCAHSSRSHIKCPSTDHKWSGLQIECYQRGHGSMGSAGGQTSSPPPHPPGSSGPGCPLPCFPPVCFFSSSHHVQLLTLVHREKTSFFFLSV